MGAVLALRPAPPRQLALAAEFPSAAAACAAVCAIMEGGHVPSLLELMDGTTSARSTRWRSMGLPETTEALLLAAFDTPDPAADLAAVGELCTAAGATEVVPAEDAAESELLLQARRMSLPALERVSTAHDDRRRVRAARAARRDARRGGGDRREYDLTIGVCAHAGDGNTHPVVCFDAGDEDESRRARESFDEIMALGLELGGTITGEHGVGRAEEGVAGARAGPDRHGDAARRSRRSSTRWDCSTRANCSDGRRADGLTRRCADVRRADVPAG